MIGATIIYGSDPMVPYQAVTPGAEVAPQVNRSSRRQQSVSPGATARPALRAWLAAALLLAAAANAGRCRRRQPATKGPRRHRRSRLRAGAISALTGRVVDQASCSPDEEAR